MIAESCMTAALPARPLLRAITVLPRQPAHRKMRSNGPTVSRRPSASSVTVRALPSTATTCAVISLAKWRRNVAMLFAAL